MNILLVCACGSSTSVVLQKMKENLTSDEPWTIEAKSLSEAKKVMGKYDYVLLAPRSAIRSKRCRVWPSRMRA